MCRIIKSLKIDEDTGTIVWNIRVTSLIKNQSKYLELIHLFCILFDVICYTCQSTLKWNESYVQIVKPHKLIISFLFRLITIGMVWRECSRIKTCKHCYFLLSVLLNILNGWQWMNQVYYHNIRVHACSE